MLYDGLTEIGDAVPCAATKSPRQPNPAHLPGNFQPDLFTMPTTACVNPAGPAKRTGDCLCAGG